MRVQSVRMGQIGFGNAGDTLVTLLGSCVAVVLFDRQQKKAGLAHIQLPASQKVDAFGNVGSSRAEVDEVGKYADTAIPALLREVLATDQSRLVVHLAGGADMFETSRHLTVGRLNIQAVERLLSEMNLTVASSDCGGTHARRVRFEVSTGLMHVKLVEKPTEADR